MRHSLTLVKTPSVTMPELCYSCCEQRVYGIFHCIVPTARLHMVPVEKRKQRKKLVMCNTLVKCLAVAMPFTAYLRSCFIHVSCLTCVSVTLVKTPPVIIFAFVHSFYELTPYDIPLHGCYGQVSCSSNRETQEKEKASKVQHGYQVPCGRNAFHGTPVQLRHACLLLNFRQC